MKKNLFLALMLISSVLLFAGGSREEPAAVTGVVEYFDGEVLVNGEPADFGTPVEFGAIVETGEASYCEIVFDQKNIFRVMESTIAEVRLAPANPEILIKKGSFAAFFSKLAILTREEPLRVRTQTAIAGVRGTAFFVKIVDDDTTYVCICNGELDMEYPDGSDAGAISSGHHKAYYYRRSGDDVRIESAPLLYHDDKGMEALADRIGERVGWYY